jgi:lipopolysaccharide export system protein LptA
MEFYLNLIHHGLLGILWFWAFFRGLHPRLLIFSHFVASFTIVLICKTPVTRDQIIKTQFKHVYRISHLLVPLPGKLKSTPLFKIATTLLLVITSTLLFSQETTRITLERADSWEYNKALGPNIQRILGNVVMQHDSAFLYCDSAYLNDGENSVIAYGNVHVKLSDTLNLYGDSLKYNGNTKIAHINSNVKLIDNETVLSTDTLVYNRITQIAQYDYWGKIVNRKNFLVSRHGYYYTAKKQFFFKESVTLVNPKYTMHSDTLMFNTVTEVAYFYGPSDITSKEDSIYCENGWYDTRLDKARFSENAIIFHGCQSLTGDSIYYEKKRGFGQVWKNAILFDSVNNVRMKGNYGEVHRRKGFAFMTDRSLLEMVDNQDTLFMHSDTIRATFDTAQSIRNLFCYYKVKFFRSDMQGMCDSMVYHGTDSTLIMYKEPIIWAENNQLSGDSISMTILNQRLDTLVLYSSAFMISEDDTNKYNQVKGRDMIGYMNNNELQKIKVIGNSETLYYIREEDRSLIGINKVISSDMLIFLENREVNSITYIELPIGIIYPEKEISPLDLKLKGFKWLIAKRPLKKEDIFTW